MKRTLIWILVIVVVLVAGMQLIPLNRTNPPVTPRGQMGLGANASPGAAGLLRLPQQCVGLAVVFIRRPCFHSHRQPCR